MTFATRILTILLALLCATAGTAAAQGSIQGNADAAADGRAAAGEAGLYEEGHYGDLDAGVLADEAKATLDTDGSVSSMEDAENGTLWAWLEIRFSAVVDALRDVAGLDAPADADANAEVYASADGVDVDANVGDLVFDDSPAGELDGATWQAGAQVKAAADGLPS